MKLLVFAHRGEAQAFLSSYKLTKWEDHPYECYQGKDFSLLICQEGHIEALKATLITLSKKPFSMVINMGIAGAINPSLKLLDIIQVRSCYGQVNDELFFKSHTSYNYDGIVDCITTNKRIITPKAAQFLSVHADIVDRELWGIAEACKSFHLPFISYKLISDIGGQANCQLIAEKASDYSYQLLEFFQEKNPSLTPISNNSRPLPPDLQEFIKSLKPTFSQKIQLDSLFYKYLLKGISYQDVLDTDKYQGWPRKKKNQAIIKKLMYQLDPVQEKLEKICQNFSAHAHIKALPHLEKPHIEIKSSISSEKELNQLIKDLKELDFSQIAHIYEGQI